jgi:hypothetical protein
LGLPHPTASAFRFSRPPDALIRPVPAGLVSCQIRSWGCALQSFSLSCSRTPSPAPHSLMTLVYSRKSSHPTTTHSPRQASTNGTAQEHTDGPRRRSRLQGLSPHKSPPLVIGGLDRLERVALLGFYPPGLASQLKRYGFHRPSPHALPKSGRKRPKMLHSRVSIPAGWTRLSRDRRPSWALEPSDHHEY